MGRRLQEFLHQRGCTTTAHLQSAWKLSLRGGLPTFLYFHLPPVFILLRLKQRLDPIYPKSHQPAIAVTATNRLATCRIAQGTPGSLPCLLLPSRSSRAQHSVLAHPFRSCSCRVMPMWAVPPWRTDLFLGEEYLEEIWTHSHQNNRKLRLVEVLQVFD